MYSNAAALRSKCRISALRTVFRLTQNTSEARELIPDYHNVPGRVKQRIIEYGGRVGANRNSGPGVIINFALIYTRVLKQ